MPVQTFKTLDLNNVPLLVSDKRTNLKAIFVHNRSRVMCWVKLWDAASVGAVNIGVTPSKMTLSASSSLLANGTEFSTIYYLQDLVFNNGVVIAGTSGPMDDSVGGFTFSQIISNVIFE